MGARHGVSAAGGRDRDGGEVDGSTGGAGSPRGPDMAVLSLSRSGRASANGCVLWSGPSRLDGQLVAVVAVGLLRASANRKTGDAIQTYIIPTDMRPTDAVKVGRDASVCGGCQNRPALGGACYVNLGHGPNGVWKCFDRGGYPSVDWDVWATVAADRVGRLGTWGDPAAAPLDVWDRFTAPLDGWLGYTHQYRSPKLRDVLKYCQVSADSLGDAKAAREAGLGSFRVIGRNSPQLQPWEILCPASEEAGKLATCESCLMCDGVSGHNVAINAHGPTRGRAVEGERRAPVFYDIQLGR
jgi:hypothetical protein